jgi:hypothetical protein
MDPAIEADFFTPGIRDLPLHYLQDWFFAAWTEWPVPKPIWAYLLPRVLEVLASGQDPANVGLEVSLNRFPTGDPTQWSAGEWSVLDRFQRTWLARVFETSENPVDDALCMFGIAGWDLDTLFAQVLDHSDAALVQRFWKDWCRGRPSIWLTAFWEGGGNERAFAFYTSDALYQRISAFALDPRTCPDLAEKAMRVAQVIEDARAWDAG